MSLPLTTFATGKKKSKSETETKIISFTDSTGELLHSLKDTREIIF